MSRAGEENVTAAEASLSGRIDQVCDAFEGAWRRGESPRLETFLGELPESGIGRAFCELLELELAYRRRTDEMPAAEEYRARFPRFVAAIDEIFDRTVSQSPAGETNFSPRTQTRLLDRPAAEPHPPREPSVGTPTSSGLRFQTVRPHARGGLGEVFVAEDRELHREVALKQIQLDYADDLECRARFVLEAEITGRLEHPGIVPVYGLGTYADGRPFYAMRFIRGESLKDAIERFHATRTTKLNPGEKGLQLRKLLRRFMDVCDALEYAHSLGIVHRDLKPANVMLGNYGETLVVDWGLAKVIGQPDTLSGAGGKFLKPQALSQSAPTQVGAVVGTPQYMSPEQAAGKTELVGPQSDVYGLGATLYCLLTGRPPLGNHAIGVQELLDRVERGKIPASRQLNSAVPRPLDAICSKAMALKPEDRYPSARALADDVEHWLADEPIAAEPDTRVQLAARWFRRHRAWTLATAIALIVVSVVSVAAVVLINRQREIADQLADDKGRLAIQERAAKAEAEVAFRQARGAVDDLFTRVSEDTLLNQPGMQGLRKDLLEKTLEYYKRFLEQRADAAAVKEELGVTLFRAGRIIDEFESPEQAVPYLRRAQLIQERLLDESPLDPKRLQALGDTENGLGRALHRSQQLKPALEAYQKAMDLRQQLVNFSPHDNEFQRALANIIMNIGLVEKDNGQLDAAGQQLQGAQQIRQQQLADGGDYPKLQRDLAMGSYNQAILELETKRPDEAAKHFDESIARFQQLTKRDPRDLNVQYLLAICYRKSGDLKSVAGPPEESARLYGLARDGFARLVDRNPEVSEYEAELGAVYLNLARHQEPATALETFAKAQAILGELVEKYPDNPQFRRDLAVTLRSLAVLQRSAGQMDLARKNLRASIDYLTTLVERFPENKDFAEQLAESRRAWKAAFAEPSSPRTL